MLNLQIKKLDELVAAGALKAYKFEAVQHGAGAGDLYDKITLTFPNETQITIISQERDSWPSGNYPGLGVY